MLERLPLFRKLLEGCERPLEARHRFLVSGALGGFDTRLPQVRNGLVPYFAVKSVVREVVELLAETVAVEALDGVDDLLVELAPPVKQEAAVRNLLGQSVLEGVLQVRKEPRFVEKLCCP